MTTTSTDRLSTKRIRAALAFCLALLLPAGAAAQAYQCRVPDDRLFVPEVRPDGPRRSMSVAGYTLALSWSPEFCRFRKDSARHSRQCSGRDGRFGFVVHGLWPEGTGGRWPQWCARSHPLEARDLAPNLCQTPDTALLAREWAKHGSCMVRDPERYFRVQRILWRSLRFPDYDRLSRKPGLTAGEIRTAFADANRHWDAEDVGLVVNNRGWLTEMRLCYGKDFMPTACDARRFGPKDSAPVKIWRGL